MSLIKSIAIALGAALCTGLVAQAQLASGPSGAKFVETAAISDMFEIESSQMALKKNNNAEIRKFAEMMVADHTKSSANLKAAVGKAGGAMTIPTTLDSKHQAMIDRLNAASGTEFEAMYVQMQTAGHEEAVSLFSAYAKDGDQSALKAFAVETLPTLKEHLEHAKKLRTKT